jgi:hypothetical protein
MEPSTAEVEGFSAEKKKGNVRSLPGGATFTSNIEIGVLADDETRREEKLIEQVLTRKK